MQQNPLIGNLPTEDFAVFYYKYNNFCHRYVIFLKKLLTTSIKVCNIIQVASEQHLISRNAGTKFHSVDLKKEIKKVLDKLRQMR